MKLMRIEVADAKRVPVEFCDAEIADGLFSRFLGLQFRGSLPAGKGLMLVPGRSVHTFFMRFAIDVVRIDATGRVIGVDPFVEPWRVSFGDRESHAVLELPAASARIYPGDWLRLADASRAPASLKFLTGPIPSESESDSDGKTKSESASAESKASRDLASEGNGAKSVDDVSQKVIHV